MIFLAFSVPPCTCNLMQGFVASACSMLKAARGLRLCDDDQRVTGALRGTRRGAAQPYRGTIFPLVLLPLAPSLVPNWPGRQ